MCEHMTYIMQQLFNTHKRHTKQSAAFHRTLRAVKASYLSISLLTPLLRQFLRAHHSRQRQLERSPGPGPQC